MSISFGEAIRTYLLANSDMAALVGTRIYQKTAPSNAISPYITFGRISKVAFADDLEGSSDVRQERWQFDSFDSDPAKSQAVSDALWAALHGKCGLNLSGYRVLLVQFDSDQDFDEDADDASETNINHLVDDYLFTRGINSET